MCSVGAVEVWLATTAGAVRAVDSSRGDVLGTGAAAPGRARSVVSLRPPACDASRPAGTSGCLPCGPPSVPSGRASWHRTEPRTDQRSIGIQLRRHRMARCGARARLRFSSRVAIQRRMVLRLTQTRRAKGALAHILAEIVTEERSSLKPITGGSPIYGVAPTNRDRLSGRSDR
jgi:hypothetical protein